MASSTPQPSGNDLVGQSNTASLSTSNSITATLAATEQNTVGQLSRTYSHTPSRTQHHQRKLYLLLSYVPTVKTHSYITSMQYFTPSRNNFYTTKPWRPAT
jgi:hypothetical protein